MGPTLIKSVLVQLSKGIYFCYFLYLQKNYNLIIYKYKNSHNIIRTRKFGCIIIMDNAEQKLGLFNNLFPFQNSIS